MFTLETSKEFCMNLEMNTWNWIPVVHVSPVHPSAHLQENEFITGVEQTPLFWHGFGWHSLMSMVIKEVIACV